MRRQRVGKDWPTIQEWQSDWLLPTPQSGSARLDRQRSRSTKILSEFVITIRPCDLCYVR